jgi:hypothetical protein
MGAGSGFILATSVSRMARTSLGSIGSVSGAVTNPMSEANKDEEQVEICRGCDMSQMFPR